MKRIIAFILLIAALCLSGCASEQTTESPKPQREALTIITVKDLSFCLEYRSVEVRGVEVELAEKEFDILALLLTNPKKVFC